ncbi:MAG: hypothetical protein K9N52_07865 [Verrucomicrobia bacterium]|nr:hypothetical protein [Verrucomicrobiota bacterium]
MKQATNFMHNLRRQRGMMLIEALVYISLLGVVTILAYTTFHRCMIETRVSDARANVISVAIKAGEKWRTDIHAAVQAPEELRMSDSRELEGMRIQQSDGLITYQFEGDTLYRIDQETKVRILEDVVSSRFYPERRSEVSGYRWELEVKGEREEYKEYDHLFSFLAVPQTP